MENSVTVLQQEIRAFIRKYYFDKVLKGGLLWFIVALSSVLVLFAFLNLFEFTTAVRTILFFSYLFFNVCTLFIWVGWPLSKYFFLGRVMSDEQAATIIGNYFPEIQDKLLNVLQLNKSASVQNNSLLLASVQQKSKDVSRFSFTEAVDLKENLKRARIPFFITVAFLAIFFIWPDFVKNGAQQLYYYNETPPAPKAPFAFMMDNDTLTVIEGEDYELKLKLDGSKIPGQVFVIAEDGTYTMKQESKTSFSYTFKKVKKDIRFNFEALGFNSKQYIINVIPSPKISNFSIDVDYPDYTGIEDETFDNTGDLSVPEGSCLSWRLRTKAVDDVRFIIGDSTYGTNNSLQYYDFNSCFENSAQYFIAYGNSYVGSTYEKIPYSIDIVKDAYPTIEVTRDEDTTSQFRNFFTGVVADDYGVSSVSFFYKKSSDASWKRKSISAKGSKTAQKFYHAIDIREFNLGKGETLQYYFLVSDNDGVNGSKSTKSSVFNYNIPDEDAMNEKREKQTENTKQTLKDLQKKSKDIKKQVDELRNELLNKSQPNWKDKQKLENIINEKESLQEQLEKMLQEQKKNNEFVNEYNEYSEEVMEKQKAIEELMENLMDEEMKKLLEELNKLMEENFDKEKMDELLKNSEIKEEQLNKELDRSLELLKNLELEQMMEETQKKLDQLAKDQEKLSEETKEKKKSDETLQKEQQKLNDRFEQVKDDLKKINEKNNQLERPKDLDELKEQQKSVDQEQKEAQENIDSGKNKKASESQKKASEEMKKMSQQMQQMQSSSSQQQQKEDMEALRQLLENIVDLSVDQENLINAFVKTDKSDPLYKTFSQEQRNLIDDAQMVEDSLFALSKRVVQLSATINKEIAEINMNLNKIVDQMQERNTPELLKRQQYVMKGYNQLALLLSDVLEQMQKQMSMSMPGTGQCEKPGGSSPKGGKGKQSLEQMKKQLQEQLDQMKKGKNPGGKNEGKGEGEGDGNGEQGKGKGGLTNQQMVKIIQEQAAMRKALEQLKQQQGGNKVGEELQKMIDDINKNKEDLLKKDFEEIIQRQQEILTRLLKSEKALREREFEDKRESEEGKNKENSNPNSFLEYKRKKEEEIELLRTVPPNFKRYYKDKANAYVNTITDGKRK